MGNRRFSVCDDFYLSIIMAEETKSDMIINHKLDKDGNLQKLILRSDNYACDTSFMNALRRSTMNSCATYAINQYIVN